MIGADHRCWDRRSSRLSPWRRRFYPAPIGRTSRRPRSRGSTGGGSRRGAGNTPRQTRGAPAGVRPRSARGATVVRAVAQGEVRGGIRTRWGDARGGVPGPPSSRATGGGLVPSRLELGVDRPATFAVLLKWGRATASRAPGYPAGSPARPRTGSPRARGGGRRARRRRTRRADAPRRRLDRRGEDDVREGDVVHQDVRPVRILGRRRRAVRPATALRVGGVERGVVRLAHDGAERRGTGARRRVAGGGGR